jgi:hypothetical protein
VCDALCMRVCCFVCYVCYYIMLLYYFVSLLFVIIGVSGALPGTLLLLLHLQVSGNSSLMHV